MVGIQGLQQDVSGTFLLQGRLHPLQDRVLRLRACLSRRTVRCLGGLSGATLLGMTKEELRTLCPEEGARVFFQLQLARAAIAVRENPSNVSALLYPTGLTGFYCSGCQLKSNQEGTSRDQMASTPVT